MYMYNIYIYVIIYIYHKNYVARGPTLSILGITQPLGSGLLPCAVRIPLRVQVPNNHMLSRNLHYHCQYRIPTTQGMDPEYGKPLYF